jgi:hypothetical protein
MGDDEVDADAAVRTGVSLLSMNATTCQRRLDRQGCFRGREKQGLGAGATSFMESRLTPAQTAPGVTTLPA